jgi:quinohemoprotein ethanol dehydrogenase
MGGWGGAAGIIPPPGGGPSKPGFGRVLTLAIGGTAKLDVPRFGHQGPPSPAMHMNASPATVRAGGILFEEYCLYSHGVDAVAGPGIPDLRYATAETHHQFEAIVLRRHSRIAWHAFIPRLAQARTITRDPGLHLVSRAAAARPASK